MTVIAWDGKILAADRQYSYGEIKYQGTKIHKVGDSIIVASSGGTSSYEIMRKWFEDGANFAKWPDCQKSEDWCQLIVVDQNGVRYTDCQPAFLEMNEPFWAWGAGAYMAIGAMAAGATAVHAVEITNKYYKCCGCGVDWFEKKK